jgi:prolyl-tRNA editing enzyme YbaK/EbsC (Cys-tRNA(Pro) deacylase)
MAHKTPTQSGCWIQMRITYELREYTVDPEDLAAETVAAKIGLPAQQVCRTLVACGDRNGICMVVEADHRRCRFLYLDPRRFS